MELPSSSSSSALRPSESINASSASSPARSAGENPGSIDPRRGHGEMLADGGGGEVRKAPPSGTPSPDQPTASTRLPYGAEIRVPGSGLMSSSVGTPRCTPGRSKPSACTVTSPSLRSRIGSSRKSAASSGSVFGTGREAGSMV